MANPVSAMDFARIASMPASATMPMPARTGIIEMIGGVPLMMRRMPGAGA